MTQKQGILSINSDNMLPIIKKWLYSDHDIFVREVISNACDAISKLHKLEIMGEYQYPDDHRDSIHVVVDPDAKTVKFIDPADRGAALALLRLHGGRGGRVHHTDRVFRRDRVF